MRLIVIAIGIIYGFLILTATTMTSLPSAHSGIVLGILPLATAMFGVLRFKEKPSDHFWIASIFGSLLVLTYSFIDGAGALQPDDIWHVLAIFFGTLGYSEGGKLAKQMGAITVIRWALALTLPPNAMIAFYYFSPSYTEASLKRLGCIWLCRCVFHVHCSLLFIQRHRSGRGRACRTSTTLTAISYSTRGLLPSGRTADLAQRRILLGGDCTYHCCPRWDNQNTATT